MKWILGIVAVFGVFWWMVVRFDRDPKIPVTEIRLRNMGDLLVDHRKEYGSYPEEWVELLVREEMDWIDLWGESYIVDIRGKHFILRSCGPDRRCYNDDDIVETERSGGRVGLDW